MYSFHSSVNYERLTLRNTLLTPEVIMVRSDGMIHKITTYSILHLYDAVWWTIACMILCVVLYVVILYLIPSERTIITSGVDKVLSKVRRS